MTQIAKKRVSKKTKGAWRKIEHKDVEEFLDDQRLEERIGKVSEKSNEELFEIDVKPRTRVSKKNALLSLRERRKKLLKSKPKCFAALENDSKVSDPIAKRNRVRTNEERKHFIAKSIEQANTAKGIIKKKLLTSVADRERAYQTADAKRKTSKQRSFDKDIWEEGSLRDQRKDFKSEWLDENVQDHNIVNTGTPVNSVPASAFHKRSKLKAVAIPHPGLSYNPTLKDHQDLIKIVEEREKKVIKKEEHLKRVTTAMFNKVSADERDRAKEEELQSGLNEDEEETVNTGDADDEYQNEFIAVNPPVVVKTKDRKFRRKQKEQKDLRQELLKKKLEKKKVTDIHRLRFLNDEIKTMEEQLKTYRERKAKREEQRRFEPHRLSKYPFEEEEIDFSTPENISGNLRNVKSEGSLLTDRFKSLQRRNILPPSKDLGLRRRREVKRYTRTTHKEIPEQPTKTKKKKQ